MTLRDILLPSDLRAIQEHFDFPVGGIEVSWGPSDGPEGTRATTTNNLLTGACRIKFDPADIDPVMLSIRRTDGTTGLHTVIHELTHVEQARRGFLYRFKTRWWNLTIKDYKSRPHEVEARERAERVVSGWLWF